METHYPTVIFEKDSSIAKFQAETVIHGIQAQVTIQRNKSEEIIQLAEINSKTKEFAMATFALCFGLYLLYSFAGSDSFREMNAQNNRQYTEHLKLKKAIIEKQIAEMEMSK